MGSMPRTLTVNSRQGLCNRLRVLLSGIALARATQRTFAMRWTATSACGSTFPELFESNWNVGDDIFFDRERAFDLTHYAFSEFPDLTAFSETDLHVHHFGWVYQPARFSHHLALEETARRLVHELKPIPALQARIEQFRRTNFRPTMIGVHLRRGDLKRWRPDTTNNFEAATQEIDRILETAPNAGILLCSDDGAPNPFTKKPVPAEGLLGKLRARYGESVVNTQAQTVRDSEAAIQDAVVDLMLLRSTDYFIGTLGSTFSEVAAFGRTVPVVFARGASDSYLRQTQILERIGLLGMLKQRAQREYGRDVPYQTLFLKYRHRVRRLLRISDKRSKS